MAGEGNLQEARIWKLLSVSLSIWTRYLEMRIAFGFLWLWQATVTKEERGFMSGIACTLFSIVEIHFLPEFRYP